MSKIDRNALIDKIQDEFDPVNSNFNAYVYQTKTKIVKLIRDFPEAVDITEDDGK